MTMTYQRIIPLWRHPQLSMPPAMPASRRSQLAVSRILCLKSYQIRPRSYRACWHVCKHVLSRLQFLQCAIVSRMLSHHEVDPAGPSGSPAAQAPTNQAETNRAESKPRVASKQRAQDSDSDAGSDESHDSFLDGLNASSLNARYRQVPFGLLGTSSHVWSQRQSTPSKWRWPHDSIAHPNWDRLRILFCW